MARGLPPNEVGVVCIGAAMLDMPLSLVGDIITLPYTLPHWLTDGLLHGDDAPAQRPTREEWERFWKVDGASQNSDAPREPNGR